MLRSFLTITLRILWRNKVTSFVNIFSLSVGITAFIFIMLYVHHETSYDKFNEKYDRIYRVEGDDYGKLPPAIGIHLKGKLPEIENVAMLSQFEKTYLTYDPGKNLEDIKQIEVNTAYSDSTSFDVFSFSFQRGNPKQALNRPMTAVLAVTTAKKLFGDEDPMGKSFESEHIAYEVTGIIDDVESSHCEVDALFSMSSFQSQNSVKDLNETGHNSFAWSATFLLLSPSAVKEVAEKKVNESLSEINNGQIFDTEFNQFHLRPLSKIYFDGAVHKLDYGLHGNIRMVMILISIAFFMLVLACVNYVNLTTARSAVRAKEIALKRMSGSSVLLLRVQLIGESIIISMLSLGLALTIVQLFLPVFNQLAMVNIEIGTLNQPLSWTFVIGGGVLMGIIAGLYPAIFLTANQPVKLVKGVAANGWGRANLRSGLMVFQFGLSVIMIVAILVNFRQLNFLRSADLGFNEEQVILINTPGNDQPKKNDPEVALRDAFKARLSQHPIIRNISYGNGTPGVYMTNSPTIEVEGKKFAMRGPAVDEEYLDVLGIELSRGKNFTKANSTMILNEMAVQELGLESPVGKTIRLLKTDWEFEIVGVVKDFHVASLHDKIEPICIVKRETPGETAHIKIASTNIPASLKTIETEFKNVWGAEPFSYQFLDDAFNRQYQRDEQLAKVIGYFTVIAVIIACLGLFALSSFMVSRRVKEIGVRKVLGASIGTIYSMLSWDFLKWILLAIVVASPVAWMLMKMWLSTFAYHIDLSVDVFVIAALIAIGIALLTVTGQSLKVARANPVDSLKYE